MQVLVFVFLGCCPLLRDRVKVPSYTKQLCIDSVGTTTLRGVLCGTFDSYLPFVCMLVFDPQLLGGTESCLCDNEWHR